MLHASRPAAARSAVAFFNMKHFQIKKRYAISPTTLHEAFSKLLRPNDRLLRQSNSGGGGARVLVLDQQQRVKGVYLPMFCMPHPTALTAASNALGITVEHYMRATEAASPSYKPTGASTSAMPTVLILLSHSNGVAYAVLRADSTVVMPLKNLPLSPVITEASEFSEASSPSAQVMRGTGFGSVTPVARTSHGTAAVCRVIRDELNAAEHIDQVSACSSFFWVTQENRTSVTHDMARNAEFYWDRITAEELSGVTTPSGTIKFTDSRWISVLDVALHSRGSRQVYRRDPVSGGRIVSLEGLLAASSHGILMLDHDPRSDFPAMTPTIA